MNGGKSLIGLGDCVLILASFFWLSIFLLSFVFHVWLCYAESKRYKAVVLRIDSPGGDALASDL